MTDDDRTRPSRIRITGLQEAQLKDILGVEQACAAMYHAIGFDAAEVPVRHASELASLARSHAVHVAEADYVPAGLVAWRDESPGVAYIADLEVHPDYQRFGIGSQLLGVVHDDARGHHFDHIVVRCWQRAGWAMAFYAANGFTTLDGHAPEKVRAWRADREAAGTPVTRPGELVLWAAVRPAPPVEEVEEDE